MTDIKGLAFFDLDGTLLNGQSEVTDEVAYALADLKSNGIIPFIATGRTNTEINHVLSNSVITSSITMNGQYVMFEGETVFSHFIPRETTRRLLEQTQNLGQELAFYTHEQITVSAQSDMVTKAYHYIHQPAPPTNQADISQNDYNMLLVLGETGDAIYQKAFPELTFYRNGPHSIDVVSSGNSKGAAINSLTSHLGLEGIPTYGFGDGPNDLPLLAACDYKIAMGNAIKELKEMATFVTEKNTENGIVTALKHYDLI